MLRCERLKKIDLFETEEQGSREKVECKSGQSPVSRSLADSSSGRFSPPFSSTEDDGSFRPPIVAQPSRELLSRYLNGIKPRA
ncbi:hypothetical protein TNIN_76861 [Trichonephila inaurata madagascariensis]|uniref:Uncharacterized protein n=1 Tax=Trichonephila inaurata madagascariensis TaxID=2747483 RepID=A0A8X6JU74_9ARAC|nr:hypothetical protein TNIN_76861 [Trichonephila inaurata madagascariensis]